MKLDKFTNELLGRHAPTLTELYQVLELLAQRVTPPVEAHASLVGWTPYQLHACDSAFRLARWLFFAHEDGLVHTLMPQYATRFWGTKHVACPVVGLTECGIRTQLMPQDFQLGLYEEGEIRSAAPTCLTCVSGVAVEGRRLRKLEKEWQFSTLYGVDAASGYNLAGVRTGRMSSSTPNMSPPPRKAGSYSLKSVAAQVLGGLRKP